MERLTHEQLQFILECALLAPSADNHHRIHFELADNVIRVACRQNPLSAVGSYKRLLALLSLGAVVENLRVAASHFGAAAETRLMAETGSSAVLLEARLHLNHSPCDPLFPNIRRRHTNRHLHFRGPRMSDAQLAEIARAANAYPTTELFWLDEAAQRKRALMLMRRAETERFRNRLLHEELFSGIRFDVGWHTSCAQGLPPGSLGVEAPLRPLFKLLRNWSIARLANLLGTHHMLGFRSCYLPCRLAPHLGLLAVRSPDNQSILDAGRSFQRLWLAATGHGRVLQPLPASALYACRGAQAEGIPEELQTALSLAWEDMLGASKPLMLFRMGYAPEPAVVTGRPPLADFL